MNLIGPSLSVFVCRVQNSVILYTVEDVYHMKCTLKIYVNLDVHMNILVPYTYIKCLVEG